MPGCCGELVVVVVRHAASQWVRVRVVVLDLVRPTKRGKKLDIEKGR